MHQILPADTEGVSANSRRDAVRSGRRLLQLAGILAGIQASAHTFLFLIAKPEANAKSAPIVAAMRSGHFSPGMLGSRTYWDFYFGYGLVAIILAFLIASVIAVAASCTDAVARRRLVLCVGIAIALHAAVIATYFFILPLVFDVSVFLLLIAFLFGSRPGVRQRQNRLHDSDSSS
jgi:hypothetical protein